MIRKILAAEGDTRDTNDIDAWYRDTRCVTLRRGHSQCSSRRNRRECVRVSSWQRVYIRNSAYLSFGRARSVTQATVVYHSWSDPSSPFVYACRFVLLRLQLLHLLSSPSLVPSSHLRFFARDPLDALLLFSHSTICPRRRLPYFRSILTLDRRRSVPKSERRRANLPSRLCAKCGKIERFRFYKKFHDIYISRCDKNRNFSRNCLAT